jgi:transcriptional regulator with XRE-family HTH domain
MSLSQLAERSLNERIVKEIRAEMARQGISQTRLGELTGRTQNTVSRRLTGQVQLSMGEIEEFAIALDVPVDQLMSSPKQRSRRRAS